jgi:hypothetical protein
MIRRAIGGLAFKALPLRRAFFGGLFSKKTKEAPAPSIVINKEKSQDKEDHSFKKPTITKEEEKYIQKREELFNALSKKREEYDSELIKRRKDIETATTASRREFEITVANLDYNRLIFDSLKMDVKSEFNTAEETLNYLSQTLSQGVKISSFSTVLQKKR